MDKSQYDLHAEIEERHWWFVGRRRIMRRLVEQILPTSKDALVIDVGCGTGANIADLADSYDCTGIDTSELAIERAERRYQRVRFIRGKAPEDLGELASQADLFMMMDVLEHIEDDRSAFRELFEAARPGAQFLLTVPADMKLWTEHDVSFGHYRRYDMDEFAGLWKDLPATTALLSYFNTRLLPIIRAIRSRHKKSGKVSGQAGTDVWVPIRPANWLLTSIFAGEAGRLTRLLGGDSSPYQKGASLIAIVRKEGAS